MAAFEPNRKVGIVILTNETLVGMPDSVGLWALDRIMDNPVVDYAATSLDHARAEAANSVKVFKRPKSAQPSPPLAPLYGSFADPRVGKAVVRADGDASVIELTATGAKLRLDGWDGSIFTATLIWKESSPPSPPTWVRCRWASAVPGRPGRRAERHPADAVPARASL